MTTMTAPKPTKKTKTKKLSEQELRAEARGLTTLFRDIQKSVLKFSNYLVAFLDKGGTIQMAAEENPEVLSELWPRFEKLGRGVLHQDLVLDVTGAYGYLRWLPYSEQARALEVGVEVLDGPDPSKDVRLIKAQDMTKEQRMQVFHGSRVYTPMEQARWLRNKQSATVVPDEVKPLYTIQPNGDIYVDRRGTIKRAEGLRILTSLIK